VYAQTNLWTETRDEVFVDDKIHVQEGSLVIVGTNGFWTNILLDLGPALSHEEQKKRFLETQFNRPGALYDRAESMYLSVSGDMVGNLHPNRASMWRSTLDDLTFCVACVSGVRGLNQCNSTAPLDNGPDGTRTKGVREHIYYANL
jgi:hypothetical protein